MSLFNKYKDNITTFWKIASSFTTIIGPLALRLVSTPSNSVPCERSFSVLKLLQNKFRSRIRDDRVDMLQYIYINRRVFDKITAEHAARRIKSTSAWEPTEEELVELEDELIKVGESNTTNPALHDVVEEVLDTVD
jgi:hypothetical protein